MKFKQLIYLMLGGAIAICSCNKSENSPAPDMNFAYFPLKLQSVIVYDVDSTVYSDFNNSVTTFSFHLKDTVTNTFTDAQGDKVYRIERLKKTAVRDWFFLKVITRKTVNNRAEEFIDNKRYVRLVFPATEQSTWNGNIYNDLGEWRYEIKNLNQPLTIGTNKLDSTLTTKYEEINALTEEINIETYAKNIGLVKKEVKSVVKNISSGQIRRGYAYTMRVSSWK
ncbi:hypothetical protein [Pedobacter sp.]